MAVPQSRKKWPQVHAVLRAIEWTHLEALDKHRELIGIVENTDLDPEEAVPVAGDNESMMGRVIIHAQDVALRRHQDAMKVLLDAHAQLTKTLMDRVVAMESAYAEQLGLIQELMVEGASNDDELASSTMMKAFAPALARRIFPNAPKPQLKGAKNDDGKGKKKKNGDN